MKTTTKRKSPTRKRTNSPNSTATRRTKARKRKRTAKKRTSPNSVVMLSVWEITPSFENDRIYRPVDENDPGIIALAESIRLDGVHEALIVTKDYWLLSGHRRLCAARLAGLQKVPCRIKPWTKAHNPQKFWRLLRECNRQRDKTADEKLREELVTINPDDAYMALIEHRAERAKIEVPAMQIVGEKRRSKITDAKKPMLDAILAILRARRHLWPLSDRTVHYALLTDPPLRHANKPNFRYQNDKDSYKDLCDLLTRARLEGVIPWEAIGDETRPVVIWDVHQDTRGFIRRELDDFLKGYWRNLMQSQPNHIEIIGEKNTLLSTLKPVAAQYCIPLTIGRGYSSLEPRRAMAERFEKSGRAKLVLLMVGDHDPDGEEICHSFARSMRDDFDLNVHPIKVALTAEQVERFNLPPVMEAKASSSNHDKFVAKHGKHVWEVEALPPEQLQAELRKVIDSVIDVAAFNAELEREKQDAAHLAAVRSVVHKALKGLNLDESDQ